MGFHKLYCTKGITIVKEKLGVCQTSFKMSPFLASIKGVKRPALPIKAFTEHADFRRQRANGEETGNVQFGGNKLNPVAP